MHSLPAARNLLALRLPEVDLLFGDLSNRYKASSGHSFGAHIAIGSNWPPPGAGAEENLQFLASVCTFTAPFEIALARVGYFHSMVYLAPEPTGPISRLETRVSKLFPPDRSEARPFAPQVSIAKGLLPHQAAALGATLEQRIKQRGVLTTVCSELSLMAFEDGQWMTAERFVLGYVSRH
ncbi:2'-5' RNA ligase family protein [Dyella acidisoli]|uniref:2'-5' RNA ligase family protein n=1 Tax=Dyella acidisoli TaxID=1867834 RepID=UPI0024E05C5E|nr:2'-5' RNA ligase family protein [Dyella acidisoli]